MGAAARKVIPRKCAKCGKKFYADSKLIADHRKDHERRITVMRTIIEAS